VTVRLVGRMAGATTTPGDRDHLPAKRQHVPSLSADWEHHLELTGTPLTARTTTSSAVWPTCGSHTTVICEVPAAGSSRLRRILSRDLSFFIQTTGDCTRALR